MLHAPVSASAPTSLGAAQFLRAALQHAASRTAISAFAIFLNRWSAVDAVHMLLVCRAHLQGGLQRLLSGVSASHSAPESRAVAEERGASQFCYMPAGKLWGARNTGHIGVISAVCAQPLPALFMRNTYSACAPST